MVVADELSPNDVESPYRVGVHVEPLPAPLNAVDQSGTTCMYKKCNSALIVRDDLLKIIRKVHLAHGDSSKDRKSD